MRRLRASAGPGLSGASRLLREACTAVAKGVSRSPTFPMTKPVLFPGLSVWTEPSLWVFTDTPPLSDGTHELILFLFWGQSPECVSQSEVWVWQGRLLPGALGGVLGARVSSAWSNCPHPWLVAPPSTSSAPPSRASQGLPPSRCF